MLDVRVAELAEAGAVVSAHLPQRAQRSDSKAIELIIIVERKTKLRLGRLKVVARNIMPTQVYRPKMFTARLRIATQ
jgi:hypothetical protein